MKDEMKITKSLKRGKDYERNRRQTNKLEVKTERNKNERKRKRLNWRGNERTK